MTTALTSGCALFEPSTVGAGDGSEARSGPADRLVGLPEAPLVLAVFKEDRELVVVRDGVPEERYPIRLGRNPDGHKVARGDHRTPEGTYRICTVKPSRFQKFLWLSYPNREDADRALREGRISRADHDRIVRALDTGQCPPYDTVLGGLTGIHGDYQNPPRRYDWTEGCIALDRNEHLLALASQVRPGTPVVILP
jgi:hypothetical protein